ncbi:mitogen-activated protein kinase, partial [Trifolium medium]|nr:mitogen-activated protein kinase [Trifolium medium]
MAGVSGGRVKKSASVKDYVMDWIGKEVKEEKLKNDDLVGGSGKGEK